MLIARPVPPVAKFISTVAAITVEYAINTDAKAAYNDNNIVLQIVCQLYEQSARNGQQTFTVALESLTTNSATSATNMASQIIKLQHHACKPAITQKVAQLRTTCQA